MSSLQAGAGGGSDLLCFTPSCLRQRVLPWGKFRGLLLGGTAWTLNAGGCEWKRSRGNQNQVSLPTSLSSLLP